MSKPLVYLAGSITGLTFEEADGWRREAAAKLQDVAHCLSPMRNKSEISNRPDPLDCVYPGGGTLLQPRSIFERDHFDCVRADLLLVNLSQTEKPSVGTAMEMAWAFHCQKPTVVIISPDQARHPFIVGASSVMVPTLAEGIEVVRSFLG